MTDKELYNILVNAYTYNPEDGLFRFTTSRGGKYKHDIAGSLDNTGYIHIMLNGKKYLAHILVWLYCFEELPVAELDHINGIKHDNRLDNLREVTRSQNNMNRKVLKSNKLGIKGVRKQANGKFTARININGKQKHLGTFNTAEEASEAYNTAAKETFKEFYNN